MGFYYLEVIWLGTSFNGRVSVRLALTKAAFSKAPETQGLSSFTKTWQAFP